MASALQEHWQQHHGTYHVLGILKLKEIKLPSTSVHCFMNAFFILGVSLLIMCDLVAAKSTSIPKDMLGSFGVNVNPQSIFMLCNTSGQAAVKITCPRPPARGARNFQNSPALERYHAQNLVSLSFPVATVP